MATIFFTLSKDTQFRTSQGRSPGVSVMPPECVDKLLHARTLGDISYTVLQSTGLEDQTIQAW